jgi:hypothetical protein
MTGRVPIPHTRDPVVIGGSVSSHRAEPDNRRVARKVFFCGTLIIFSTPAKKSARQSRYSTAHVLGAGDGSLSPTLLFGRPSRIEVQLTLPWLRKETAMLQLHGTEQGGNVRARCGGQVGGLRRCPPPCKSGSHHALPGCLGSSLAGGPCSPVPRAEGSRAELNPKGHPWPVTTAVRGSEHAPCKASNRQI